MDKGHGISHLIRNFLFTIVNKEFLIFLFFLALSAVFWLQMTLNETYEKEFLVPMKLTGVPQNVVLTSDEYDTIKVTLRDKGLQLISYTFADRIPLVKIPFGVYAQADGHGSIPAADIQKYIYQKLPTSTKITQVKPDRVEFFYNYGLHKRVPVKWVGHVAAGSPFFIANVKYLPDSVDVYATRKKLDSIQVVQTEALNYTNFRDTLTISAKLEKIRGAKVVPNRVSIRFMTDVLTEERVNDIPIHGINMPPGKVLRTFPSKVSVSLVTGVKHFKGISPADFTVVVDYKEIEHSSSDKCQLHLKDIPQGVSRVSLSAQYVDYLIEDEYTDQP